MIELVPLKSLPETVLATSSSEVDDSIGPGFRGRVFGAPVSSELGVCLSPQLVQNLALAGSRVPQEHMLRPCVS